MTLACPPRAMSARRRRTSAAGAPSVPGLELEPRGQDGIPGERRHEVRDLDEPCATWHYGRGRLDLEHEVDGFGVAGLRFRRLRLARDLGERHPVEPQRAG